MLPAASGRAPSPAEPHDGSTLAPTIRSCGRDPVSRLPLVTPIPYLSLRTRVAVVKAAAAAALPPERTTPPPLEHQSQKSEHHVQPLPRGQGLPGSPQRDLERSVTQDDLCPGLR